MIPRHDVDSQARLMAGGHSCSNLWAWRVEEGDKTEQLETLFRGIAGCRRGFATSDGSARDGQDS
jgi:hypothetical protein